MAQDLSGQAFPAEAEREPVTILSRLLGSVNDSVIRVELTLKMGEEIHIFSEESRFFTIQTVLSQGLGTSAVTLPRSKPFRNFDGTKAGVYTGEETVVLTYPVLTRPWRVRGFIQYQACDEKKCFFPTKKQFVFSSDTADGTVQELSEYTGDESEFSGAGGWKELADGFRIEGRTGGYQSASKFLAFLRNPPATRDGAEAFAGKNIWLVIILVLLGGIALNLTPCVLPMIPITVAILGAVAQAGSRLRGFLLGSVYGFAMAMVYGIVGLIAVLSGTQFGTINSLPAFNIIIAIIFGILAFGMFDIIHIDFTRFRSGIRHNEKNAGKFAAAFFMGIVAALLAGACVAPAVISTILYSATLYSGGAKVGLLLPLLLGLGMALPWPFAGAGLSFLPKPGKWMIAIRNLFGVIILAIAL
ncbi:MAG: hypothetical protein JXA71_01165, partial [Chitinispirillaceae bacterium]|nr:hypothetical protein [Chitinispirillaceae bacterium]